MQSQILNAHPDLTKSVIFGLGWLWLLLAVMNMVWIAKTAKTDVGRHKRIGGFDIPVTGLWALYTSIILMVALAHFAGFRNPERFMIVMPDFMKTAIDAFANPIAYFVLSIGLYVVVIWLREWLVKPQIGWVLLNASVVFLNLSLTDYDFRKIVGKPDNVPIVAMLYLVAGFTWLYFYRAVDNDKRLEEGRPLYEEEDNKQVLVWPDLVYTELICMIALTALLIFWGIALQAPLEEPANSSKTPNPSKAPWYFLGLQEMLVYFDPWLAGVVLPTVMLVGLMAIPYIDFNKTGNGYYVFKSRFWAVNIFLFGFLPLWVAMIILGTFLRGPNWNFYGIYEYWDPHKLEVANNVNLSEYVWIRWLGLEYPTAPADANGLTQSLYILMREAPGFLLIGFYFAILPFIMAATFLKEFASRMGFLRFMVFVNLLLFMMSLPIKMVLRWTIDLKYLIAIPEWFFNV